MDKRAKIILESAFYLGFFYCLTFAALFYFQMKIQAYPIPENTGKQIEGTFALFATIVCVFAKKKKSEFLISSVFVLIAASQISSFYIGKGFDYTKLYASEMAHAVEKYHTENGKWPDAVPPFKSILPSDVVFSSGLGTNCDGLKDGNYCIIAGFHIWYNNKKELPFLSVSSRQQEMESRYNWDIGKWIDQPPHRSTHD